MISTWVASATYPQKEKNEDAYAIQGNAFVVADGVGSSLFPHVASQLTAKAFAAYFAQLQKEPTVEDIDRFVVQTAAEVSRESRRSSSTVVCVWFPSVEGETLPFLALSIGDSRLYSVTPFGANPHFRKLSKDHVAHEWMGGRWRRSLACCIGPRYTGLPERAVFSGRLAQGEWLMLLTDGCWEYLQRRPQWFLSELSVFRVAPREKVEATVRYASVTTRDDATMLLLMHE